CAQLDQNGRKQIIEMLWEIAMADRVVHEFESNLVWRVAELLGVSARDRELLRKTVASRLGLEAES
ncbi:MAG: TerB family tellurite resistance protein, partial [Methyloceanibacter sp.]